MTFFELVEKRYSVRRFSSRPVEDEKMEKLLALCRLAPSARNQQPCVLVDIKSQAGLAAVRQATRSHFEATRFLLVAVDPEAAWIRADDGHSSSEVDAAIVGSHVLFGVTALGLGTTWVGRFDARGLHAELKLPANLVPVALFPLGYPADDSQPSEQHSRRRPLTEILLER